MQNDDMVAAWPRLRPLARRRINAYGVIAVETRTRIVRIGSSLGIRLPRTLVDQAGLPDEVVLHAVPGCLIVRAPAAPKARAGWEDAARATRVRSDDTLLDAPTATRFDRDEWTW